MTLRNKDDAAAFREAARTLFFSNETVEAFLERSSAAQVRCAFELIGAEIAVRERNRRARLLRRARFPFAKSVEGYDFSVYRNLEFAVFVMKALRLSSGKFFVFHQ